MAKRNQVGASGTPTPAMAAEPIDLNALPVNVIHDRLNQAHATLDLIHTMTTVGGCADAHIETLCKNTLGDSIHSAMLRIEEAMEAAERLVSHG
jgi:hypothetical protein